VDTNILICEKAENKNLTNALMVKNDFLISTDLKKYFSKNHIKISNLNEESFVILSKKEFQIKQKIEKIGKPLKDWNIKIFRGVLTGFNEAFIIDENKKNELINADPKNAEIIKPILRGRDIKKYSYKFANLFLINSHNGIKSKNIERINVKKDFPKIYEYFLKFEKELRKRRSKGKHWTNLRSCTYFQEFEKDCKVFR